FVGRSRRSILRLQACKGEEGRGKGEAVSTRLLPLPSSFFPLLFLVPSSSSFFLPSSSNPELPQVMVNVAVGEYAPRFGGHLSEHRMLWPLRLQIQFLERLDSLTH